jgi:D-alanyl-D-alanine carboxypeptidase
MGIGLERFDWFVTHVMNGTLDADAVREGVAPPFLEAVPVEQIVQMSGPLRALFAASMSERQARDLGNGFEVLFGGQVARGAVEPEAPHRFIGLVFQSRATPLDDDRLVDAPFVTEGDAPLLALRQAYAVHGLVGVVAAAFDDDGATPRWLAAGGYSDLDARTACTLDTRMLAGSISKLLTAVTALQLVAEGSVELDAPANTYLQSLRVETDAVTVRHLLTHAAGVSSDFNHYVEVVPAAADVLGDVVKLDFAPGSQRVYSNGGYTVLGEVIADVTGVPVVDAITNRVLLPLGMADSSFATSWPDGVGPGYVATDGRAEAMPKVVPSVPAAGGLVTTTRDLARFVAGWQSLLPTELAEQAVTPQVAIPDGGSQGFGWILGANVRGHAGGTMTYSSSLLWWPTERVVHVLIINRHAEAETINVGLRELSGA